MSQLDQAESQGVSQKLKRYRYKITSEEFSKLIGDVLQSVPEVHSPDCVTRFMNEDEV